MEGQSIFFLLGLMDKQTERKHGTLFLYRLIAARLLYAQRFTNSYNGRLNGEANGIGWGNETMLIEEKTLSDIVFAWKPTWTSC